MIAWFDIAALVVTVLLVLGLGYIWLVSGDDLEEKGEE